MSCALYNSGCCHHLLMIKRGALSRIARERFAWTSASTVVACAEAAVKDVAWSCPVQTAENTLPNACPSTIQIRRRRRPRPGVTAAPTTAALATGAGPGVTALATTAVLATGWPMTPRRARRAGLSGISVSFFGDVLVRLDRGDNRLDRDSPVGNQLATRTTDSRCKRG